MKTAEEILKSKLDPKIVVVNNPDYTFNKVIEAMEEYANQSKQSGFGGWVATSERLPEIPKDAPSYSQHVKVIACWGNREENMVQMNYCRRIVRGKEVHRFEWMGKLSPWKVDYWMEFPMPPVY